MTPDLNEFLQSVPSGTIGKDFEDRIRIVYDSLTDCFATSRTHVTDIVLSDDASGVSIILTTPYLSAQGEDASLLADLFRIADAVAIAPTPAEDGFDASIVFTIME